MDADLASGALTYIGCQPGQDPNNCQFIVGGTSLSSPLTLAFGPACRAVTATSLDLRPAFYRNATPYPASLRAWIPRHRGRCNGLYCAFPGTTT